MFRNDDPFAAFDLAEYLLECIRPSLQTTGEGLPGRMCVHTGEIAWDDCECGQLVVSLMAKFDSGTFPEPWTGTENAGARKCGAPLFVYHYRVSMLRCAPTGGENGVPPTCDELRAAARVTVDDAWAVLAGLNCCLCADSTRTGGQRLFNSYHIGPQTMIGPEGGCQGSVVDVYIGVPNGGYPCSSAS